MNRLIDDLFKTGTIPTMNESITSFIGKRIAEARDSVGLSQEALADAISVSVGMVSKWERGLNAPKIERLVEISKITKKPVYWFFAGRILSQEGETLTEEEENLIAVVRRLNHDVRGRIFQLAVRSMLISDKETHGDPDRPKQPTRGENNLGDL